MRAQSYWFTILLVYVFVGMDRLPGIEDRPNLGYTEAVLHESMRLSTVAPFGLFHATMCDTEICKLIVVLSERCAQAKLM